MTRLCPTSLLAAALLLVSPLPEVRGVLAMEPSCAGDCNVDGTVRVNELVTMVAIALGAGEITLCAAGDVNRDGRITVDELVTAVNRALMGCQSQTPTTSPAVTSMPTVTLTRTSMATVTRARTSTRTHTPTFTATGTATTPELTATSTPSAVTTPVVTPTLTPPPVAYRLFGLDVGFYLPGQGPGVGSQITEEQIRERLALVSPYTRRVRVYSARNGHQNACRIAHELGLECAQGIALSSDATANAEEIANAVGIVQRAEADQVIVGNEVLLRGDLSESQLIASLNEVRAAIPAGIPVTTAETWDVLIAHPDVIAASDVLFANIFPYWQGADVSEAICVLDRNYRELLRVANGKPVWISESGWPSAGDTLGTAVPSEANAAFFFEAFTSWARSLGVSYFYFSAVDEAWKAADEGPQGAHWGLWSQDGVMKPGMEVVFEGETAPPATWGAALIDGAGTPAISFTHVPAYGSFDDLRGRVQHVAPREYYVTVYIRVDSLWWGPKPTTQAPRTPIDCTGGTWQADYTTGGTDQKATRIKAFLLPASYDPPGVLGASSLPLALDQNALASAQVDRAPDDSR